MNLCRRLKSLVLSPQTTVGKIARLIYNEPALLTPKNGSQFARDVRELGFNRLYEEKIRSYWGKVQQNQQETLPVEAPIVRRVPLVDDDILVEYPCIVSVIIPVKNAGDDFVRLLSVLKSQKGFRAIEIVVVDSGSSDQTRELAKEFGAKVIEIRPEEFLHSYARNLGAEHASGEYLLFTVQDALPPSDTWLSEMFRSIKDGNIVGVSCAEFPREDGDLFYRALSWNHYRFLGVNKEDRILCDPDPADHLSLRRNGQFSNIACLISKDIFLKYRFISNYAEDLDLGMRLVRDGHKLALLGSTRILHSHNRSAYYHLRRGYVDMFFISKLLPGHQAAAIGTERLLRDMGFTLGVADSILCDLFTDLEEPCSVTRLSEAFIAKLDDALQEGYRGSNLLSCNGYIDENFRAFVEKFCLDDDGAPGNTTFPYDGLLIHAMRHFMMTIFEYMNSTYDYLDGTLIDQFKASVYKACAFQFGCHLAACVNAASDGGKAKFAHIHNELMKDV